MNRLSIVEREDGHGAPLALPDHPHLSIVVPIYNEEENIPLLYARLTEELAKLARPYEIIAVDDGSRDTSFARLRDLAQRDPRLRVVRFRRNFGQTAAFAAGFDRALWSSARPSAWPDCLC